jgi:hypothetical protein
MKNTTSHLWIWFKAAFSDGEVQAEEKKVLFDLALRGGADMSEISEIWDACVRGEGTKVHLPTTMEEKEALFEGLIKVVLADDEVTRNEDRFLRRIAKKLGMESEVDSRQSIWGESRWPKF